MSKYEDCCDEIAAKIRKSNQGKGKPTYAVSKGDLSAITTALINDPEYETTTIPFSAKEGAKPDRQTSKPGKRYRRALKSVAKSLGVDPLDADKLDEMPFTSEHADSIVDVAVTAISDYMRTGRKFSFPIKDEDEARMDIMLTKVPERVSVNRFVKDDSNDDVVTVTAERKIAKVKNSVPAWLKTKKSTHDK